MEILFGTFNQPRSAAERNYMARVAAVRLSVQSERASYASSRVESEPPSALAHHEHDDERRQALCRDHGVGGWVGHGC